MAKVAFDATILMPLVSPNLLTPPIDKNTSLPVTFYKERIEYLVSELDRTRTKIIIPTPALSEVLVYADKATLDYVTVIRQSAAFKIEPFDDRSAVEVAMMIREAKQAGDKRGGVDKPWAQIKFDRQIVAISKISGAATIYSDDPGVATFARRAGLMTITIGQLALPSEISDLNLFEPVPPTKQ
jgi:hypothetical protein